MGIKKKTLGSQMICWCCTGELTGHEKVAKEKDIKVFIDDIIEIVESYLGNRKKIELIKKRAGGELT